MSDANKCLRRTCGCPVAEGEKYCSLVCEDAGPAGGVPCNCGHRGCIAQASVGNVDEEIAS